MLSDGSTVVGRQAVREALFIVETLAVRTQEVELSCEEKTRRNVTDCTRDLN